MSFATLKAAGSPQSLGYAPHIVLAFYLVMLLGLGVAGWMKSRGTEEDYYLAGRGQGLLVTALTIMATYFSGVALLGFPGAVYSNGVAAMFLALNLPVAGAAVYLLGNGIRKLGKAHGYVTPADMLADYYGGNAIRLLAALMGALYVLPYVIIQIKAGGTLAESLFAETGSVSLFGWELSMYDAGATALSVVTMIYVLIGGMRSVAWTDVVQGILLLFGCILAGVAVIVSLGGPGGFFAEVAKLDPAQLTMHDPLKSKWNPFWLMTFCAFASLASIVQPAQWMRFYSARSGATLRRSAVIFAVVLPCCFIFGVMLVGLVGRSLHPGLEDPNQIAVLMLREQLPQMLGALGVALVAVILVAILAASMSTADSNLHALSGVVTRDLYDRYVRPEASEGERAWVGRSVIILTTLFALAITYIGKHTEMGKGLLDTILQFFFLAMAFSCQLLPAAVDILYIRKGTRAGAVAGIAAGAAIVFAALIFSSVGFVQSLKLLFDLGFIAVSVNVVVFIIVSRVTAKPDPDRIRKFSDELS